MNKTIKQRAYEAVGHPLPQNGSMQVPVVMGCYEGLFLNGYIKGATEQNEIIRDRLTEMQGEYITLELIEELVKEFSDEIPTE